MQRIPIYFRCILLGTYYAELKALLICMTHLNNLYLNVTCSVIQILLISIKWYIMAAFSGTGSA